MRGGAAIHIVDKLLDMIYPRRCPACDGIVPSGDGLICRGCVKRLPYIKEPYCMKCGKELRHEEEEYCEDCRKREHVYTAGRALFSYNEVMQRSVSAFKYKGRQEYAVFYGSEMAKHFKQQLKRWGAQVLIPVPVHKSRYRQRGYNQAALLAKSLSRYTGIPVDEGMLVRSKKTAAQKTLNNKERRKNLQGAFQLAKNVVQYKKIVLVDDIYTTGSTADACAGVLIQGGAEHVYLLCLCIGSGL